MDGYATGSPNFPERLRSIFKTYARDPRTAVALLQILFIAIGIESGRFDITWLEIALALITSLGLDFALTYHKTHKTVFPLSAVPTALGIGLYLRSPYPLFFLLCAAIAILSKHYVRLKDGRHIFNPSNLGIILCAFAFPSMVTIEFTQWGTSYPYYLFVAVLCLVVAWWADVLPFSISFFVSYAFFLLLLLPHAPDIFAAHFYGLLGPSLVVFATLMATDPRTIPRTFSGRVGHGFVVAGLVFFLEFLGIRYGLLLALTFALVLNPLSEYILSRTRTPRLRALPSNALSVVCVAILWVIIFFGFVGTWPAQFSRFDIALDFLGRGIEANALVRPVDPVFVPSSDDLGTNVSTFGAAWGDYNGDGYDDLFVSNVSGGYSRLYRNNGNGTFTDVTAAAGLPDLYSSSAYFVDYNNDGRLDLFIVSPFASNDTANYMSGLTQEVDRPIRVFRNNGNGTFTEVTNQVGLGNLTVRDSDGGALAFADFTNDGRLDFVFVTSGRLLQLPGFQASESMLESLYDQFFPRITRLICGQENTTEYLSAHNYFSETTAMQDEVNELISGGACLLVDESLPLFAGQKINSWGQGPIDVRLVTAGSAHLFENKGGTFVEQPTFERQMAAILAQPVDTLMENGQSDFTDLSGRFFQPFALDYNDDGKPDIIISSDVGAPIVLKNIGNFTFENETTQAGLDVAGTTMGVTYAENASGTPELYMTNVLGDFLFAEDPDHAFSVANETMGPLGFGWGVSFLDYDLSGHQDLFVANGTASLYSGQPDPNLTHALFFGDTLYTANDSGGFTRDWTGIVPIAQPGKAVAVSDFNDDGTPDVFVGNIGFGNNDLGQRNILYINTTKGKSWLKVSLHGIRSNSFGVGAYVTVSSALGPQTQLVSIGGSFYSQNSLNLLFGLGTTTSPVTVEVKWPSGITTINRDVTVDQDVHITE